jgi:hypothetical protein
MEEQSPVVTIEDLSECIKRLNANITDLNDRVMDTDDRVRELTEFVQVLNSEVGKISGRLLGIMNIAMDSYEILKVLPMLDRQRPVRGRINSI